MSNPIICRDCGDNVEPSDYGQLCGACGDNYRNGYAKAISNRNKLRRVLERCLMYGQLPIDIANEARKLLEAKR